MVNRDGKGSARSGDGPSRRDFLRAGSLTAGAVGLSLGDLAAGPARNSEVNCILLFLVGAPSQIDTWDPKPDAPDTVRGPFRSIATRVPGIRLAEPFPRMAARADRFAIVRSVHHDAAPIHETGQQLLQTGRLCRGGVEHPHYGAVLSHLRGPRREGVPPFIVLPTPIEATGVSVSHGQGAGHLGSRHEPVVLHGLTPTSLDGPCQAALDLRSEPVDLRERYGRSTFGQSCLAARRLIEGGVRLVTVNACDTVFNRISWDCHADGGSLASTLEDYRDTLCPQFDAAYSALLDDLHERGLLESTLVLAMGEFGRTPLLNPRGGRDHWPGVWSILFAGAGVRGGQVVGSSDAHGAEPRDRPVSPAEVAATVYRALASPPTRACPARPADRCPWPRLSPSRSCSGGEATSPLSPARQRGEIG